MGRLDTRLNFANGQPVPDRSAAFDYTHDAGDRRAAVTRADGSRIDYAYDPIGQVTGAVGVFDGGLTNRAYRFSYDYDPAGNPLERTRNGARREFVSNQLNQLTSATAAAAVDVSGRFDGPIASVAVNTTPGAFLGDRWWAEQVSIVPGTNQLAAVITPPSAPAQTNTLSILNAPAEAFTYDLNGCMTSSGSCTNTWDEENRLIETAPVNPAPGALKVVNQYDPLSRRTVKQVFTFTPPAQWTLVREHRFTWIDWLLVREYITDMPQGLPPLQTVRDYVWGVDLSGTLQGAGAVGGLLAVAATTPANPQPAVYYPAYDGNGNVHSATDAAGATVASFEYDPFGNLLSADGPAAAQIPFRFSTKYTDAETRLVYYGYRFYAPEIGRWPNRDPMGERGGVNTYNAIGNNAIKFFDYLGLKILWMLEYSYFQEMAWMKYAPQLIRDSETLNNSKPTLASRSDLLKRAEAQMRGRFDGIDKQIAKVTNNSTDLDLKIVLVKSLEDMKAVARESNEGDHIVFEGHSFGTGLLFGREIDVMSDPSVEHVVYSGKQTDYYYENPEFEAMLSAFKGKCLDFTWLTCDTSDAQAKRIQELTGAKSVYFFPDLRARDATRADAWGVTIPNSFDTASPRWDPLANDFLGAGGKVYVPEAPEILP